MGKKIFNNFDELNFDSELEKVREEYIAVCAQHQIMNEMVNELYQKCDFDSETMKLLKRKYDFVSAKADRIYDVLKYLSNLKNGYPFYVRSTVGRYMVKFGLTEGQSGWFLETHKKHMAAMGTENQKKYCLPNVRNVIWDKDDDCLKIYYEDVWWHYGRRGDWY